MSTFIPATRETTAKANDKSYIWTLALVLIALCLVSLVLALTSESFAHALQLLGQVT